MCPVNFEPDESPDDSMKKVAAAIQRVSRGKGVLVLTDMFGGTPSNLSLSFLEEGKVEVLTGVQPAHAYTPDYAAKQWQRTFRAGA